MVENTDQTMCIISVNKYTIVYGYRSHNMFDGVQCEAIQNDVVIWKEH